MYHSGLPTFSLSAWAPETVPAPSGTPGHRLVREYPCHFALAEGQGEGKTPALPTDDQQDRSEILELGDGLADGPHELSLPALCVTPICLRAAVYSLHLITVRRRSNNTAYAIEHDLSSGDGILWRT